MPKRFKPNSKMRKDNALTQLYCTNCNANKNPKRRIISLLGGQTTPTIAAQCNQCRTVMFKTVAPAAYDSFVLSDNTKRIGFRLVSLTLDEYREKYDFLAIKHNIRKKHKLDFKAPVEMVFDPEAEQILGLNAGILKEFRLRKMSPTFYVYQNKVIYWKQDLLEWKKEYDIRHSN